MMLCPICSSRRAKRLNVQRDGLWLCRCLDCQLVHWAEIPDSSEIVESYHDYYTGRPPELSPITEKRYHAILQRCEQYAPPGPLLEVGCGMGHLLAVAEGRGWQPVGLEVSASGCEQVERLKAERGWRFEVREGDVMRAAFPEGSFRAIILIEVLEHLIDPLGCLKRLQAWLEPGGVLYLTTPNFDSLSRYALAGRWRAVAPEHLCLFNPRTLRAALGTSGFRPVRLVTKNIDLPEIMTKWRRGASNGPVSTAGATEEFRRTVEDSRLLYSLKAAVNTALRVSGLGESLELFAVKPRET